MKLVQACLAGVWVLSGVTLFHGTSLADDTDVIYGDDDRRDVFDPANDNRLIELAKSTAALVRTNHLEEAATGQFTLPNKSFAENYNLCEGEPFRDQPNPAFCSGFLVGEDVLVTAGHCIQHDTCETTSFVFDFAYTSEDTTPTDVSADNVFHCKEVLAQKYESGNSTDYAVVRLDRKATGRTPLSFRKEGTVSNGTEIVVIGHPAGLPTKIAAGAVVRDNTAPAYFVTNLDTYGGNSGSAVFDLDTGTVEGILVRGDTDFVTENGCRKSNICTDSGCRGEDVTKATEFARFVPDGSEEELPTFETEFTAADLAEAIPDNDPAGVTVELPIDDAGPVAYVSVNVKAEHTYLGDLELVLIHPDGTEVIVYRRGGGTTENLDEVFGKNGRAVSELVELKDKEARGTWQLKARDLANRDTGTLQYVKLTIGIYQ